MTRTNIYNDTVIAKFKPTFLYIKRHSVTGLLYFGKTTQKNPIKYLGSGKYWVSHYKKHGKEHIETIWYELFTDAHELTEFALFFSENMNIVESKEWANLVPENGLQGGGLPWNSQRRIKYNNRSAGEILAAGLAISRAKSGKPQTSEHTAKVATALTGTKQTPGHTAARAASLSGCSFWNNGKIEYRIKSDEFPDSSWFRGKLPRDKYTGAPGEN